MWKVLNQFRVLLSVRDKLQMAGLLVLMFAGALLELAGVSILMPVVAVFTKPELLQDNRYLAWFYERIAAADYRQFTLILCSVIIVFFLLKNLYALGLVYLQSAWVNRKIAHLLERLFGNYLAAPYRFHLEHDSSELQYRKSQLGLMAVQLLLPFLLILTEGMVVLVIAAMLMFFAPAVTLLAGSLTGLLLGGIYLLLRHGTYRYGRRHAESEEKSLRIFTEAIGGIKETRLFGAEPMFAGEFRAEVRKSSDNMTRLYAMGQIPRLGIESITIVLAMLTLMVFTLSGLASGSIILIVGMFVLAIYRLLPSFTRIHYNLMLLRQYSYIFTLIYEDLTALPREDAPAEEGPPVQLEQELAIHRVSFRYSELSPWIFRDFSLTVKPFSSLALTGRTGCGKTTLADLLMGLLSPVEGDITVDGRSIQANLPAWRRRIGYVPQTIYLLNGSIRRNIAFGIPDSEIDDDRIWECLALAQIDDFVRGNPQKLQAVIGERGVRLSGGQRQRLGIARALYRRPQLLILDEATSALDQETEQALVDAIGSLQGKLTMIVIAHRLSTVEKCDVVLDLNQLGCPT